MIVQSNVMGSYHMVSHEKIEPKLKATNQSKPGNIAKDLVQDHIVWGDPRYPIKVGETLCDESGEPIPHKAARENIKEIPIPSDGPTIRLGGVCRRVVMQSVHERGVGQGLRPDHGSRPDQEAPHDTSHTKAKTLCCKHKEHLEAPAKVLLVKDLLGQKDVGRVGYSSLNGDVGHHDDHSMLLDIERARVEVPLDPQSVKLAIGENLHDNTFSKLLVLQTGLRRTYPGAETAHWIGQELNDVYINVD